MSHILSDRRHGSDEIYHKSRVDHIYTLPSHQRPKLDTELTYLENEIASIKQNITDINSNATNQGDAIATINNTLSDHATSLTNHQTSITGLNTKMTTAESAITDLQKTVGDNKKAQDTKNTEITKSITDLTKTVTDNKKAQDTISTNLSNHTSDKSNPHGVTLTQIGAAASMHVHATHSLYTMTAAGWNKSAKTYSFESAYPVAKYDLEIFLSQTCTADQMKAWSSAQILGSHNTNVVKAFGDVPTINIPVILKVVQKKA